MPEIESSNDCTPYIGLRAFEEKDKRFFKGRRQQVKEVLERLARLEKFDSARRFLAVVGPSGGGKSSLVLAGVMPALSAGNLPGANSLWVKVTMRPAGVPQESLSKALAESFEAYVCKSDVDKKAYDEWKPLLQRALETTGETGLATAIGTLKLKSKPNVLIVVDQFEELFRYDAATKKDGEAAEFVSQILYATSNDPRIEAKQRGAAFPNVYVIATMRSDYLGECARYSGLAEAVNDALYLVPRLGQHQLQAVIEQPALECGGKIDDGLVVSLLNDVIHGQDTLPVLQHALMRCWKLTKYPTEDTYEARGGSKALEQHLNKVLERLAKDDQGNDIEPPVAERKLKVAERLFKRLTKVGNSDRLDWDRFAEVGVRDPVTLRTLSEQTGYGVQELTAVMDEFRKPYRSFLRPSFSEEKVLSPDSTIDITHESLIRIWTKLGTWLKEEFEAKSDYLALLAEATKWGPTQEGDLAHTLESAEGTLPRAIVELYRKRKETYWSPEWARRYRRKNDEKGNAADSRQDDDYRIAIEFLEKRHQEFVDQDEKIRLEKEREENERRAQEQKDREEADKKQAEIIAAQQREVRQAQEKQAEILKRLKQRGLLGLAVAAALGILIFGLVYALETVGGYVKQVRSAQQNVGESTLMDGRVPSAIAAAYIANALSKIKHYTDPFGRGDDLWQEFERALPLEDWELFGALRRADTLPLHAPEDGMVGQNASGLKNNYLTSQALAVSAKRLIAVADGSHIHLGNLDTKTFYAEADFPGVLSVAFNNAGNLLLAAKTWEPEDHRTEVRLYRIASREHHESTTPLEREAVAIQNVPSEVSLAAFSNEGKIVIADQTGAITFFEPDGKKSIKRVPETNNLTGAKAIWDPMGEHVLFSSVSTSSQQGKVCLSEFGTVTKSICFENTLPATDTVAAATFDHGPDGKLQVLMVSAQGKLIEEHVDSRGERLGQSRRAAFLPGQSFASVDFLPDSRDKQQNDGLKGLIVVGSGNEALVIGPEILIKSDSWQQDPRHPSYGARELHLVHQGVVTHVEFVRDPPASDEKVSAMTIGDNPYVLTASADRKVRLFDASTGQERMRIPSEDDTYAAHSSYYVTAGAQRDLIATHRTIEVTAVNRKGDAQLYLYSKDENAQEAASGGEGEWFPWSDSMKNCGPSLGPGNDCGQQADGAVLMQDIWLVAYGRKIYAASKGQELLHRANDIHWTYSLPLFDYSAKRAIWIDYGATSLELHGLSENGNKLSKLGPVLLRDFPNYTTPNISISPNGRWVGVGGYDAYSGVSTVKEINLEPAARPELTPEDIANLPSKKLMGLVSSIFLADPCKNVKDGPPIVAIGTTAIGTTGAKVFLTRFPNVNLLEDSLLDKKGKATSPLGSSLSASVEELAVTQTDSCAIDVLLVAFSDGNLVQMKLPPSAQNNLPRGEISVQQLLPAGNRTARLYLKNDGKGLAVVRALSSGSEVFFFRREKENEFFNLGTRLGSIGSLVGVEFGAEGYEVTTAVVPPPSPLVGKTLLKQAHSFDIKQHRDTLCKNQSKGNQSLQSQVAERLTDINWINNFLPTACKEP